MKRALVLIPVLAISLVAWAGSSLTATIDGSCTPHNATLTVPAGKAATGFKLVTLASGTKCTVGGTPDTKGWGITSNGTKVYYWSQFQSNAPAEVGGALSTLTLGPGTYQVFVDGGSGAQATIEYTVP